MAEQDWIKRKTELEATHAVVLGGLQDELEAAKAQLAQAWP